MAQDAAAAVPETARKGRAPSCRVHDKRRAHFVDNQLKP